MDRFWVDLIKLDSWLIPLAFSFLNFVSIDNVFFNRRVNRKWQLLTKWERTEKDKAEEKKNKRVGGNLK